MGIWQLQSNFNRGELDPVLAGRTDMQAYYNGMQTAQNVLTIPQGGVKRRPGMEFLGEALGNGRMEVFSFSTALNYLLVFTELRMQVYKDGVLQTNINGSGFDYLVTPWTAVEAKEFDYIQSLDTAIIVHTDVEPYAISRTSDTDWDASILALTNIPQFNYIDGSSPTPVSEIQDLVINGVDGGSTIQLNLEGILTGSIGYQGPGADWDKAVTRELIALPNTGTTGIAVSSSGTVNNSTTTITFSGSLHKRLRASRNTGSRRSTF